MALAMKCDICGDLYEIYDMQCQDHKINAIHLVKSNRYTGISSTIKKIDCCPNCLASILQHLDALKEKSGGDIHGV